jgi:hypothetical protein
MPSLHDDQWAFGSTGLWKNGGKAVLQVIFGKNGKL